MNIIDLLNETSNKTLPYYNLPEAALNKRYAPGKWTVKEILIHLADAEAMLHERIQRVIAEPRQVIWAFNQDLFCAALEYQTFPIHLSQALFLANRNSIIFLAEKFYVQHGSKQFIHSETGIRTLKDEFDKVASHNQNHLHQIETAINS